MPLASSVVRSAACGTSIVGWKLNRDARRILLQHFPPCFRNAVADRVVLMRDVAADTPLPSEDRGRIVGHARDRGGVEAMIVAIDGSCERPGGGTYHITWSVADAAHGADLGHALSDRAWTQFGVPIPVQLVPAML